MKRAILIVTVFTFLFSSPAFGQFTDVPVGHWSNKALYDLVKMGVTQGYPDGTFRGSQLMNRYEIAIFLAKLAAILETKKGVLSAADEKLVEEFRAEVAVLQSEFREAKDIPKPEVSGSVMFRFRHGNTLSGTSEQSSRIDYRLKTRLRKDFKNGVSVQIELDTLDAGFGTETSRGIARKLLNVEGKVKFDTRPLPITLKAAVGPAAVSHVENDPALPSENYTIFVKPKNSVELSTSTYGMDLSLAYVIRYPTVSGEVRVHEITATTGFTVFHVPLFNKLRFYLTPRYLYTQDGSLGASQDVRGEMKIEVIPSSKFKTKLLYGTGSSSGGDNSYINIGFTLNDIWGTGTFIVFEGHSVGSNYRITNFDKYEFVYLNLFDKLILDGTSDISIKIIQNINDRLDFVFKADEVLTRDFNYGGAYDGTSLTLQGGINYAAAEATVIDLFYRLYEAPSGVANAVDPGMRAGVHKSSALLGLSLTYNF